MVVDVEQMTRKQFSAKCPHDGDGEGDDDDNENDNNNSNDDEQEGETELQKKKKRHIITGPFCLRVLLIAIKQAFDVQN